MVIINTPITEASLPSLSAGKMFLLSGWIYTGRDAALPRLVHLIMANGLAAIMTDLQGAVIFHTAVSPAGVGPTSSNKHEIESTIPALSKAGVKIHLGKGRISPDAVMALHEHNSIYAVLPPVTALLVSRIIERRVVAFPELGMEALHQLRVEEFPCIVAAARGETIFD